jgi:hypothetical protein
MSKYDLYDLIKVSECSKGKLERFKAICDERDVVSCHLSLLCC